MHDTFLFKKIADQLDLLCKENNISKLTYIHIDVHQDSHITSELLFEHLSIDIPHLIDDQIEINITRNNTIELTAIFKTIEGRSNNDQL